MIGVVLSILGTLGFCAILNAPTKKIIWIIIGSAISAGVFQVMRYNLSFSLFVSTASASFLAGLYSEIIARVKKTPSTVILLPSTIPLLPGASLYYAMSYLVSNNFDVFLSYAAETLSIGVGIAAGAIGTSIILMIIRHIKNYNYILK